ncbi:4Fe-4S binding protein [Pseudomonas protegens]|uniref:4Fe-4S binding protein n=1 Tax=Pseudomonas protegens TaxID=380021 RepID=UPI003905F52E
MLATQSAKPPRCKAEPGVFKPIVDPLRCEGKGDCAVACPFDVFDIGRMPDEQFSAMPLLVKFKLWAHGRKTAFTPNADACRACGACVTACPERAITLARTIKTQTQETTP